MTMSLLGLGVAVTIMDIRLQAVPYSLYRMYRVTHQSTVAIHQRLSVDSTYLLMHTDSHDMWCIHRASRHQMVHTHHLVCIDNFHTVQSQLLCH